MPKVWQAKRDENKSSACGLLLYRVLPLSNAQSMPNAVSMHTRQRRCVVDDVSHSVRSRSHSSGRNPRQVGHVWCSCAHIHCRKHAAWKRWPHGVCMTRRAAISVALSVSDEDDGEEEDAEEEEADAER